MINEISTNIIKPIVKQPIIKRIKKALIKPFANIKNLVSDVFEREKAPHYIVVNGKKIDERNLPNCVSSPSDWAGVKAQKIVLDPEDVERLEKLPYEEKINARWALIKAGKYKVEDY